jgi:phosphate starvation-inducible PhoH-like protein
MHDMVGKDQTAQLLERGIVEIAPLAYMRGRTLSNAFVVLDEAQNTTPEQMKMFLTRLGFDSKMVVTGDITQVDVPGGQSGLRTVVDILDGVEGIHFERLGPRDIVRHRLVSDIVDAYDRYDQERMKG